MWLFSWRKPSRLVLAEPALEVGPGVHAGGGVALEEHLVAAARVVRSAEEVVHPDLVERRGGRVRRDVAADADARPLGAVDHDRGVPAQPAAVLPLDVLVAGEPRLLLGADRVDVVGRRQRRDPDLHLARPLQQLEHDVARPGASGGVDDPVKGLEPLLGLLRVGVGELARDAVEDGSGFLSCHGASSFHTATSSWPSSSCGVCREVSFIFPPSRRVRTTRRPADGGHRDPLLTGVHGEVGRPDEGDQGEADAVGQLDRQRRRRRRPRRGRVCPPRGPSGSARSWRGW